jgi:hypothetical protein
LADDPHKDPLFDSALQAIADGTPLPWDDLDRVQADPARLDVLRTLDAIASAYRANANAAAADRPVLFRWGGLDVEQSLGAGGFGEAYRAYDPWLGRHVALKLFRDFDNSAGLDEARRLARLRHRNVLSVYGCGVHDGRAGLWSELIDGRTLADAVAAEGAFSSEEALRVGRDLAQALAVVHGAGIVHGDVKAENVMRESGGRIVLMDFGAGGDARSIAGTRLISGTPRCLPPEVLDGAAVGTTTDVYAFGVLMFLLLSGRYPYTETDAAALREQQRTGERSSLRSLRPQLDAAACALVEDCIANDPARRPADGSALRDRLATLRSTPAAGIRRQLPQAASIAALAALAAVGVLALRPAAAPAAWESSVQFLRVEPAGDVPIATSSVLHVGDRLRIALRSSRDAYAYVLNEDANSDATVLFPAAVGGVSNPLHGGATTLLPGGGEASTLAWKVNAASTREEFVVVVALAAQTELEADLAAWAHAHEDESRAVDAVVKAPPPQVKGERLRQVLARVGRDPERVRVWQFSFAHSD